MPANEVCSSGLALVAQKLTDLKITVRPIEQWEFERHFLAAQVRW